MAQKNIDFGTFPDDPSADAIRTAFEKVQDNFTDLYKISHSTGVTSFTAGHGLKERNNRNMGDLLLDSLLPNVTIQTGTSLVTGVNQVVSGNSATIADSNLKLWIDVSDTITTANAILQNINTGNLNITGNITGNLLPNGTYNLGSSTQKWNNTYTNNAIVTSNITTGNITVGNVASATYFTGTLTTNAQPNITSVGTLVSLSVAGNITSGNLITGGVVTATGNVTGSNVLVTNTSDASSAIGGSAIGALQVSGGAYIAKRLNVGNAVITSNVVTSNVNTSFLGITGNIEWNLGTKIYTTNLSTGVEVYSSGPGWSQLNYLNTQLVRAESSGVYIEANSSGTSKVWSFSKTGSLINPGDVYISGNIANVKDITSSGKVTATGNISGANITATGNLSVNNITSTGNLSVNNITSAGNITVNKVTASGNLIAANTTVNGALAVSGNISGANIIASGDLSVNNLVTTDITASGTVHSTDIHADADIVALGYLSVTRDILANNLSLNGSATLAGNVTANTLSVTRAYINGNVAAANISSGNDISASRNITSLNVTAYGTITSNELSVNGSISGGSITGTGSLRIDGRFANVGNVNATSVSVSGSITGLAITGTSISGDGSALTNLTGQNVTGTVPLANYAAYSGTTLSATTAGTVTNGAQPNITSVGVLANVTSIGNVSGTNVISSGYVVQSSDINISAAGTTQSTAKLLTKQVNAITTVTTNVNDGVRLPPTSGLTGVEILIMNLTGSSLKVYPAASEGIAYQQPDTPLVMSMNTTKRIIAIGTRWYIV